MPGRLDPYVRTLTGLRDSGVIGRADSVFVQFAGAYDESVCADVGLEHCVFGNIAPNSASTGETSAHQVDAHDMPYEDGAFDHVVAHLGLHHCSRPHEALHEMYRLARKTVVFVENQDSLLMRAAESVGAAGDFELEAVRGADYSSGGVDGSPVPNYSYRWTRRELRKVVATFDPAFKVPIMMHTEWSLDGRRLVHQLSGVLGARWSGVIADGVVAALNRTVGRQGNIFVVVIRKDLAALRPWMATRTDMRR